MSSKVEEKEVEKVKPIKERLEAKKSYPTIFNKTMTTINTEYKQKLPPNTRKFTLKCRDGTAFRLAFKKGKVATPTEPYWTMDANAVYYEDVIEPLEESDKPITIYFACGSAGKVVEIIVWS